MSVNFCSRSLDDLRKTRRDFGQSPAPDAYLLVISVNLHARAIVFVFERGLSVVCLENFLEVLGELGKHRKHRNEEFYVDLLETRFAFAQCNRCDLGEVGQKQRGTSDQLELASGGLGDRFLDQAIMKPDAELVVQKAKQDRPL